MPNVRFHPNIYRKGGFMNAPQPAPPTPNGGMIQAGAPTVGSVLGSLLGELVAHSFNIGDPATHASVIAACAAVATMLLHWLGSKIGASL